MRYSDSQADAVARHYDLMIGQGHSGHSIEGGAGIRILPPAQGGLCGEGWSFMGREALAEARRHAESLGMYA